MRYRIGSFNCKKFGFASSKSTEVFADIITEEKLDVIALQEITSMGAVKRIVELLAKGDWDYCHDSYGSSTSPNEYAYIWKKSRLRECSKDEKPEVYTMIKSNDIKRKPYYGRFTPSGENLHGGFFEIRLINVHLFHGDNGHNDRSIRIGEYDELVKEIYTRIGKKRYGNFKPAYTILLGDYNLTAKWCSTHLTEGQKIVTYQEELTTLKNTEDDFCNNYDHFSFDESRFSGISAVVSRINSVEKYCDKNFEQHRNSVSDHVPIVIELTLNERPSIVMIPESMKRQQSVLSKQKENK